MEPLEDNVQALVQAFLMIILSEIGDKTFLIAAILAMRHPRLLVFAGAFSSLLVMSVLSASLGHALPALIPKRWTQFAASALFLVFGSRMWVEGRAMHAGTSKVLEEMREAEDAVETDEATVSGGIPLDRMEAGRASAAPRSSRSKFTDGARNLSNFLLGPVFVQAFVLTFLGEWGDRSQIATIALGAAHVRCFPTVSVVSFDDHMLDRMYIPSALAPSSVIRCAQHWLCWVEGTLVLGLVYGQVSFASSACYICHDPKTLLSVCTPFSVIYTILHSHTISLNSFPSLWPWLPV